MSEQATVLVVDDTPANIDLLRGVLRDHYRVKVATNGAKALQIAAKAPPPDLILLDVVMPEMDGYEVCRRLKADPATASVPVLFVTGNTEDDERAQGMALGARGYVTKPIDPSALMQSVAAALAPPAA